MKEPYELDRTCPIGWPRKCMPFLDHAGPTYFAYLLGAHQAAEREKQNAIPGPFVAETEETQ